MRLLWFWQLQKLHCNPGLVIVLQLLTGEGEQDSAWSQEPEVAGQSGESLVSQLLLSLTELLQFLGGGQGQPVSRHFQDEQFPGVGSDEVPQLSLLSQLGKVGSPKCVSFGFSGDKSDCYPGLVIILQLLTGKGEQEQDSAVLGAWNQRWRDKVVRASSASS